METIKVKAWGKGQGDFVILNKDDFDVDKHELFDAAESPGEKKMSVAGLKEALTAKGIEIPEGAKKADLQALLDAVE